MRLVEQLPYRAISLILAFGFSLAGSVPVRADEPLQGKVEEADVLPSADAPPPPMEPVPVPVVAPIPRKPLEGRLEQNALQGGAQGTGLTGGAAGGGWAGNPQQPRMDQLRQAPLQGSAGQNPMTLGVFNDPDANNQEVLIDWDRWRNTLMQAIQSGTLAKINVHNDIHFVWDPRSQMMLSRYPNGTSAWYACDVLPNRRIINIRLTQSSRYPSYDQAVLQAINDLQGNNILTYPIGSRRQIVSQEANVKTAGQTQSQDFKWGDVERQRY